ncbi:DUF262 domain-containing protein [Nevskia ramosa]|uniref:DUF262 domain-containing protein n=1 Tax=Nevskia ramosa TaxID=64002 RepID=UPI002355FD61|nr:DUF262 domain-containing protein [Nevskia ramosa]
MPSFLEQYRIADFLDWHKEKRLELNPDFQRGSVWTSAAKSYLIDTILRQLPIPKVYLRTRVNVESKKSTREVVDGQQRLRAIIEFADDKFALSKRAGEFSGSRYSTLSEDLQERFLSYAIAVDQLVNANDSDVLEVFARLNSYSVALNAAEKRHAEFQSEIKWAIREASKRWDIYWVSFGLLSTRERVRMKDDSIIAEMVGFLLDGVGEGAESDITAIYKRHAKLSSSDQVFQNLDRVLTRMREFCSPLIGTPIMRTPHFLMLFAATAAAEIGIPKGKLAEVPAVAALLHGEQIVSNLQELAHVIDRDDIPDDDEQADFWRASKGNAHRMASRQIRFPAYYEALTGKAP